MLTSIASAGGEPPPMLDHSSWPPTAVPAISAPPAIPTDAPGAQSPANTDPVGLLAEAVEQLKLAVAALNRANGVTSDAPPTDVPQAKPSRKKSDAAETARTQIENEIAVTQAEMSAFLDSRRAGIFGNAGFTGFGDANIPFSGGSFANESGAFAAQTNEPEL